MPDPQRTVKQFLSSLHRAGVSHVSTPDIDPQIGVSLQPTVSTTVDLAESSSAVASTSVAQDVDRNASDVEIAPVSPSPELDLPSEPTPPFSGDQAEALKILQDEVAACTRCRELASTRTQTVFGVGDPNARLLFLGEAPGADEDRQGEPFVGAAGQKLTEIIEKGMKLSRNDVYIMNVLKCRPPKNRNPTAEEADNCRAFLDRQLQIIHPEFICCLGGVAATNLLRSKLTIGRLRGKFHDYNGVRVMATYHPAYLLRNPSARKQVWEDIQMLMAEMKLT